MQMSFRDKHHVLHDRQEWTLRPQAERLREIPTLVPEMDRRDHDRIHAICPSVPLLGYHTLQIVQNRFVEGRTTLQSMDNLMAAIERSKSHPRAHQIEKDLADLAIHAIDLQRPLIAEALGERRLRLVI